MLVVGVSGVTNGGKTTLAKALHKAFPGSHLVCQDTYFLPQSSEKHTLIPKLNHFNWEIMSSLDMDKMWEDIRSIIKHSEGDSYFGDFMLTRMEATKQQDMNEDASKCTKDHCYNDILIIEGFLVLNYEPIVHICNLKYHLTLSKEECLKRRVTRVYDPPDVPGYFDGCVWPEYVRHKEEMLCMVKDVKVIDGTRDIDAIISEVMDDIKRRRNLS